MSTMESFEKPQILAVFATRITRTLSLFTASIKAQSVLFLLTALYIMATYILARGVAGVQPYNFSIGFLIVLLPFLALTMIISIIPRFIHICRHIKPEHPLQALYYDLKDHLFTPRRLSLGLPVIIASLFFTEAFTFTKVNIPVFNSFSWDVYFMKLDRWMHFGYNPWEILQPVLGYAPVTFLLNLNYNLWFVVLWTIFIWQAFAARPSALRLQFFLSFMLIWSIGGSLLAVVYSSAGPAFYDGLNLTPNPYKELMAYLYQVNETLPIWALSTQELLWQSYVKQDGLIAGISAMPSLHNATAVLFALLGWKVSRALGIALTIFAILIFLGSIHLGWHYAVDGYFSVALSIVIWWFAGKIALWAENRPAAAAYQAFFDD